VSEIVGNYRELSGTAGNFRELLETIGNREPESKHCSTLRVEHGRNGSARAA